MNEKIPSDIQAAVDAGEKSAHVDHRITDVLDIPVALVPAGMTVAVLDKVLATADSRADAPARRRGIAAHDEVQSFIDHVNRFKNEHSVIFADISTPKIIAVFNYNPAGGDPKSAGWGDHKALYKCPLSKQWQKWLANKEKIMSQDQFAEFIDANIRDLANPSSQGAISTEIAAPAAVVEMARNLIVHTGGTFQRTVNQTTGEATLINKTEHTSQSTKIHRAFLLGIPVFEAGESYALEARVHFQLRDGRALFSYSLFEVEKVLRDAFDGVRAKVAEGTKLPMFAGSPE